MLSTRRFNLKFIIINICGILISGAYLAGTIGDANAGRYKIACSDGVQLNGVNQPTPYCRHVQLAEVAREYGMTAQLSEVLYNPFERKRICDLIGFDIRVNDECNITESDAEAILD